VSEAVESRGQAAVAQWPVGDDTDAVTECGSCGSPLVYFDPCDGWSCNGCGRNDSDG
jgi:hypothetical protein